MDNATPEELDLIARAMDISERLKKLTEQDKIDCLIYGLTEEPLRVRLTHVEFMDFYNGEPFYYEFETGGCLINPSYVSMVQVVDKSNLREIK